MFNQKNQINNQAGFTLLEMLVVLVIIGILAVIGIGGFQSSQKKARDSKRKAEIGQIGKALELYYNDKGQYPLGSVDHKIMGCGAATECDWGDTFTDDTSTIYMVTLPADPASNFSYYYDSDGTYYRIYARLENNKDIDVPKDVNDNPQIFSGLGCGAASCNYGIASSNITLQINLLATE